MLYTSQTDIKRVPLYIEHLLNEVSNNIPKILYALVVKGISDISLRLATAEHNDR